MQRQNRRIQPTARPALGINLTGASIATSSGITSCFTASPIYLRSFTCGPAFCPFSPAHISKILACRCPIPGTRPPRHPGSSHRPPYRPRSFFPTLTVPRRTQPRRCSAGYKNGLHPIPGPAPTSSLPNSPSYQLNTAQRIAASCKSFETGHSQCCSLPLALPLNAQQRSPQPLNCWNIGQSNRAARSSFVATMSSLLLLPKLHAQAGLITDL